MIRIYITLFFICILQKLTTIKIELTVTCLINLASLKHLYFKVIRRRNLTKVNELQFK